MRTSARWPAAERHCGASWFGANASGPDAPNLVRNDVVNYSAAYVSAETAGLAVNVAAAVTVGRCCEQFGWQAGNGVTGCRHEEAWLRAQTAAVKALAPAVNTLAYIGNGASLLDFYDAQHKIIHDPGYSGFFLPNHHDAGGRETTREDLSDCPTSSATWDFRSE